MKVLFFGDSHANYYIKRGANKIQNEVKFKTHGVQGATAQGVVNPHSKTHALNYYRKVLGRTDCSNFDYFAIMLGEVDCGFLAWYRADKYGVSVFDQILIACKNIEKFLVNNVEQVFNRDQIVVVGATLPTILNNTDPHFLVGARSKVDVPLKDRIDCTFEYNKCLEDMAEASGYLYFDISNESFDFDSYSVRSDFLSKDKYDHHFDPKVAGLAFVKKFKNL